jgi:hypothetical protein
LAWEGVGRGKERGRGRYNYKQHYFLLLMCNMYRLDLLGGVRVVTLDQKGDGEFLQLYQYGLRLVVVLVCGERLGGW